MKKLKYISTFLLVLAIFSSCATRKTFKTNEKIKIFEKGTIDSKSPGDRVYITFPRSPKDRPKSVTKRYEGKRGAIVDVPFDSIGNATGFLADCPQIDEQKRYDSEMDYKIKTKETERKMNELVINKGYNLILKLGMMGFGAWTIIGVSKGFFNRRRNGN